MSSIEKLEDQLPPFPPPLCYGTDEDKLPPGITIIDKGGKLVYTYTEKVFNYMDKLNAMPVINENQFTSQSTNMGVGNSQEPREDTANSQNTHENPQPAGDEPHGYEDLQGYEHLTPNQSYWDFVSSSQTIDPNEQDDGDEPDFYDDLQPCEDLDGYEDLEGYEDLTPNQSYWDYVPPARDADPTLTFVGQLENLLRATAPPTCKFTLDMKRLLKTIRDKHAGRLGGNAQTADESNSSCSEDTETNVQNDHIQSSDEVNGEINLTANNPETSDETVSNSQPTAPPENNEVMTDIIEEEEEEIIP